jgi:hypothetical protein
LWQCANEAISIRQIRAIEDFLEIFINKNRPFRIAGMQIDRFGCYGASRRSSQERCLWKSFSCALSVLGEIQFTGPTVDGVDPFIMKNTYAFVLCT